MWWVVQRGVPEIERLAARAPSTSDVCQVGEYGGYRFKFIHISSN